MRSRYKKLWLAALAVVLISQPAQALIQLPVPNAIRVVQEANGKYDSVRLTTLSFTLTSRLPLNANRLEMSAGHLSSKDRQHTFISVGPVWQKRWRKNSFSFVEFGISPTFIDGDVIDGRNIGGNFHFTSFIALSADLDERKTAQLSLRIQHTSNGGIDDHNPGLDMVGLGLSIDLLGW